MNKETLEKICEDIENLHREHYFDWKPTREQLGYRKAQIDIINYLQDKFKKQATRSRGGLNEYERI